MMSVIGSEPERWDTGNPRFVTTRWSVVLAAGETETAESQRALAALCETYWYPVYAYVRRSGHSVEEAQDLAQGFFSHLLAKKSLHTVKREGGKFRSFLLATLTYYMANEWDRARAAKRGGGQVALSLDFEDAEGRYRLEAVDRLTPERIYERRWAEDLLDRAMARLEAILADHGKRKQYEALRPFLIGERPRKSYDELARLLQMKETAVRVAVHRLRRRFAELVREEVAETLSGADDIEEEIRYLISCFG
jgi:RNA polymerase sigma-70 factor (ECF subfamily)